MRRPRDTPLLLAAGMCPAVVVLAAAGTATVDASLFAAAGERLLSADGRSVFDDPALQVGPVALAIFGAGARAAGLVGAPSEVGAALVAGWALVAGLLVLAAHALQGAPPAAARALLAQVVLGGPVSVAVAAGHLEDLLAVLLVAACGAALHRGAPGPAGALVGAAACTKLWALLAVAALLCLPDRAARVRALLSAGAALLVLQGPFLAGARTGDLTWAVADPSVVALVVPTSTPVPWQGRLLQLTVGAVLVVLLLRRSLWDSRLVWTVPAAVVCARLLTEPRLLDYYWCAAGLPAALFLWAARRPLLEAAAAAAACSVVLLAVISVDGRAGSVLATGVLLAASAALHRAARGPWQPWSSAAHSPRSRATPPGPARLASQR